MVRQALIICACVALAGCGTLDNAAVYSQARQTEAVASAPVDLPAALPEACTTHVGRVRPTATEPRVITLSRWEIVAGNRDWQADDCGAWWSDFRAGVIAGAGKTGQ